MSAPHLVDSIVNSLPYMDRARVRTDVIHLLVQIPSLKPQKSSFTHNNGYTSELLQLSGTIPIFYQGTRYNIPISIWVLEQYPLLGPIVYVTPTPDMMIRPSHRHVGADGMVYLPYLADWSRNQPRATIMELIGVVSSTFGSDPPVFKKPVDTTIPMASPYVASVTSPSPPSADPAAQAASSAASKSAAITALTKRIQEAMQAKFLATRDDLDEQLRVQAQLERSAKVIDEGLASLEAQKRALEEGSRVIEAKTEEMMGWLESNEGVETSINPADILEPVDGLSRQLLDVVAETAGYEDALYHLNNALQSSTISFESFIQAARRTSEKQFLSMALAQKIGGEQRRLSGM